MVVKLSFDIRPIRIEDLKNNKGLYKTLERLSPSPKIKPGELSKLIKEFGASSKTSRCFTAVSGDRIVGTVTVWITSRIPRGHQQVALVEDLVVREQYEDLGIGQALIDKTLDFARSMNCQRVRLVCKPGLEKFYEKSGFRKDGISMRLSLDTKQRK